MVKVYSGADPADAHLVRGFLASHGIDAVVTGEALWGARGELPFGVGTAPTVCVRAEDAERARELICNRPKNAGPNSPERGAARRPVDSWQCSKCGEQIEGQFTSCWNCGEPSDRS
jgi:Putative prokaryotic signal transducing protein